MSHHGNQLHSRNVHPTNPHHPDPSTVLAFTVLLSLVLASTVLAFTVLLSAMLPFAALHRAVSTSASFILWLFISWKFHVTDGQNRTLIFRVKRTCFWPSYSTSLPYSIIRTVKYMRRDIRSLHIHMPSEVLIEPDLSFDGSSTLSYAELYDCYDQSLWTADR